MMTNTISRYNNVFICARISLFTTPANKDFVLEYLNSYANNKEDAESYDTLTVDLIVLGIDERIALLMKVMKAVDLLPISISVTKDYIYFSLIGQDYKLVNEMEYIKDLLYNAADGEIDYICQTNTKDYNHILGLEELYIKTIVKSYSNDKI